MNLVNVVKKALHIQWGELLPLLRQMSKDSGRSKIDLFRDVVDCYTHRGCTWSDYSAYGFQFQQDPAVRDTFMGQYEMHEVIDRVNTREAEHLMEDRAQFLPHFKPFIKRSFTDLRKSGPEGLAEILKTGERVFAKKPISYGGKGIHVVHTAEVKDVKAVYDELCDGGFFIVEEGIVQHPEMAKLSHNSVNTIRLGTGATKKGVYSIPYAAIRLSLSDAYVDNTSSGGASAVVSVETGKIMGPLITYLPTVHVVEKHPDTGFVYEGFQIPYFEEAKALVLEAAKTLPDARFIGWDIAITPTGPDIVEVNANPSPALPQSYASLPGGIGIKQKILDSVGIELQRNRFIGE